MSHYTRSTAAALILFATVGAGQARADEPEKQWVWLQSQNLYGYGYQIQDGPHKGLWRIDEGSKCASIPGSAAPAVAAPATASASADPYGFEAIINRYRAAMGLPPVSHDHGLSHWARLNNLTQCGRGIGHHVSPGDCYQNCGWNMTDAETAAAEWMNSPGHRENMLLPGMTRFGIAYGPGPYWTLNLR
jgi:hypothetical protein